VGRLAGKGKVTIENVRVELQDVLHKVRNSTGEAVKAAKREFGHETALEPTRPGGPSWSKARALRRARREERRRRGGGSAAPTRRRGRRLLTLPFVLIGWMFRNALQVALVAAIIAVLCKVIHLGLQEMIL